MEKICIKNARIVLPDKIVNGNIISIDGKIAEISDNCPDDCAVIDAKGLVVTPGFVEIHAHGGGGSDFCDSTPEAFVQAVKSQLSHGTTYICPTIMSCTQDRLMKVVSAYRKAKESEIGVLMHGLHLEGPYLNPDMCGAQRKDIIREPSEQEVDRLFDFAGDVICHITAAPEVKGVDYLAKRAKENNILLSIGHSGATAFDVEKAIEKGFSHVTHLYSATTTVRKINQRIYAGILEAAFLYDDIKFELIGDGRHVAKHTMQMALKVKGAKNINLTSDAMRSAGQSDVTESYLGDVCPENRVIIDDGVAKLPDKSSYAGSIATGDVMFKNAVDNYGISMVDAVTMLSATPALLIGAESKGSIEKGKDSDLVIWNEDFTVNTVVAGGRIVSEK